MQLYKNIFAAFLLLLPSLAYCQEESEEKQYFSEMVAGINLNTNASLIGGIMAKYSREFKKGQYHYFGLEIVNVKHRQEQRMASPVTGNLFVDGKLNNLFPIRWQYGREFTVFHPAEEEGVEVDFIVAGGPTIGLLKPYMVEYDYGNYSQIEPFDPNKSNAILGSGGILSGFDRLKIVPGLNAKASFCFKFSQFRGSVTGFEAGVLVEAYTERIRLLAIPSYVSPQPYSPNVFSSVFINVFFGLRK